MKLVVVIRVSLLAVCISVLASSSASAQSTQCPPLATVSSNRDLIRALACIESIDANENANLVNNLRIQSTDAIARLIGLALATTPSVSSSAGFTLGPPDKVTGDRPLRSDSFGPTFADRPLTNGKGVLSIGVNFQYAKTAFGAGADVTRDGGNVGMPFNDELVVYTDRNVVQSITRRTQLDATSQTLGFLAAYGVSDRLDIGVQIPVVSVRVTGFQDETFRLPITQPTNSDGTRRRPGFEADLKRSASGIGDVTIRTKYSFAGEVEEGAAVSVDVRLPTGNDDELLGAGKASVRFQALLLKAGLGPATVHANAGYTIGGFSDELSYVVGLDAPLAGRNVTASATFLGHNLRKGALPTRVQTFDGSGSPSGPANDRRHVEQYRFRWDEQSLNLMQLAAGVKMRIGRRGLLSGTVLIPLNRRGLQSKISPVVGFEWTRDR